MRVDGDWLEAGPGEEVSRVPTVRTGASAPGAPLALVWHWTAGLGGPEYGRRLAESIREYRRRVDRPASWHLLVDRAGRVFQSAPFSAATWHVGRPGTVAGKRFANINRATVGVELENAGRLLAHEGRFYAWPYYSNPGAARAKRLVDPRLEVPRIRVAAHGDSWYEGFTAAQELAAAAVVRALAERYDWPRERFTLGHRDFDSPRKEDPGPLWADVVLPRVLLAALGGGV